MPNAVMRRRTLLRWTAIAAGALRIGPLKSWAQTASFPGEYGDILASLATIVLPSEIGAAGIAKVADDFERWVREYRAGAEMDHGYGNTRLRNKPASPAPTYLKQLAELRGPLTAQAVETALDAAHINDIPRSPAGQNVIADLMAFYFRGSDANDLCYRRAIGRDLCRSLAGSDNPPPPLKGLA
jgi:hypothetical protein